MFIRQVPCSKTKTTSIMKALNCPIHCGTVLILPDPGLQSLSLRLGPFHTRSSSFNDIDIRTASA